MDPKNSQSSHEELQPDQGKSVAHKNRFQIARDLFFACKDYVLKDDRLRNILVDAVSRMQAAVDVTILAALTSDEEIYPTILPFMVIYLSLKYTGQSLATVSRMLLIYNDNARAYATDLYVLTLIFECRSYAT
ncbi:hypothetical protein DFJ43DRAFT_1044408 [Lentinula guzmanii]|uniref:Uncharacterized protein n=1 Tax=Lentinula guzmanii TaxID=2804957 RepID=A0AA38J6L9_9AGAR|nr:hypothetical protein DFJ43DRAFT_1044408 [Lentinula guzmanii]